MPLLFSDIGSHPLTAIIALGEPPKLPWYQSEWFIIVPTAILFFAGLLLGYIIFKPGDKSSEELAADAEQENSNKEETEKLQEELTAGFERTQAQLRGEIDAAELLISGQKKEILDRDAKLALNQTQFKEKEKRVNQLVELTKSEARNGSGNKAALAHARASVMHLTETIKGQRQQITSGISRLEAIENRVGFQNEKVWEGITEVDRLQTEVSDKGGWRKKDINTHLKALEDQLRVHHQNASGCVQQAVSARKRLQDRETQLRNAQQPIICVEKTISDLEASDDATEVATGLENAAGELKMARELVSKYDNQVQQEISELDGRVDWLINDSSRQFVATLDGLKNTKQPRNRELREDLNAAERKLSEIKALLTRTPDSAPASDAFTGPITPRRRINPAFDEAIAALTTAAVTPAPEPENPIPAAEIEKLESELEALQKRLADAESSKENLQQSFSELQAQLEEVKTKADQPVKPEPNNAPKLMRRLLGLGPDQREKALQASAAAALSAEDPELNKGMTGPQLSITELKSIAQTVDTEPVNGRANGAEVEELKQTLSAKDEKISALESEIRQLTAPIPSPTELGTDQKLKTDPELPEPKIVALSPSQFTESEESDSSDASIPIPPIHQSENAGVQTILAFRGDDPTIWNTNYHDAKGNFAIPLQDLPQDVQSISLKRLDTNEAIEIPVTRETLIAGGSRDESRGWSGKGEHYFGSMHLGIYDESLPHNVETKFGSGGWGFGHRYEISSGQAFAWAGEEISPVRFEISVKTAVSESDSSTQQGSVDDSTGSSRETEKIPLPKDGLIVFRSNSPELWNCDVYHGANRRARSLEAIDGRSEVKWLKLTRCDSRESVIIKTDRDELAGGRNGSVFGFNGSNELFYGAHHLGVFDSGAKLDVETRFTFGGWGFGHLNSTSDEESQACGWAGEEIAADTVFEIRVFSEFPDIGKNDTVIGGDQS